MRHHNIVRTKQWHIRCSLACSTHSVIKTKQNSKWHNSSIGVKKHFSTVHYCAMFHLLNVLNKLGAVECVTDVLGMFRHPL